MTEKIWSDAMQFPELDPELAGLSWQLSRASQLRQKMLEYSRVNHTSSSDWYNHFQSLYQAWWLHFLQSSSHSPMVTSRAYSTPSLLDWISVSWVAANILTQDRTRLYLQSAQSAVQYCHAAARQISAPDGFWKPELTWNLHRSLLQLRYCNHNQHEMVGQWMTLLQTSQLSLSASRADLLAETPALHHLGSNR